MCAETYITKKNMAVRTNDMPSVLGREGELGKNANRHLKAKTLNIIRLEN